MDDHGLSEKQINLIKSIVTEFAPAVESVSIFGSRATGSHRSYSDIDMVLYGNVEERTVDRLWTCFHESSLPYKVDLVGYNLVEYPPLKIHIDQFAKVLLTKEELWNYDGSVKDKG